MTPWYAMFFYVEILPRTFQAENIQTVRARIWFVLNDILLGNSRSTSGGEKDSLTKLGVLVPY